MTQVSRSRKQNQGHREQIKGCPGGGGWGKDEWEAEVSRHRLLHMEWSSHKVLPYSAGI